MYNAAGRILEVLRCDLSFPGIIKGAAYLNLRIAKTLGNKRVAISWPWMGNGEYRINFHRVK